MADLTAHETRRSSTAPAIFSSDTPLLSSPPSSPPGFPWETKLSSENQPPKEQSIATTLKPPPKTAFSLLGKRKALGQVAENPRPVKKSTRHQRTIESKPSLTQLQISLGQRVQTTCTTCGMEYVASSAEDRKLHDVYHGQHTEGYDMGKDFVRKGRDAKATFDVLDGQDGDVICAVDCTDTPARRKRAQAVLERAQKDLGAVSIDEKELWSRLDLQKKDCDAETTRRIETEKGAPKYTAFMYVRGAKCVGFLLAERITEAFPVVAPVADKKQSTLPPQAERKGGGSALVALRARRQAEAEATERAMAEERKADDRPLQLSTKSEPASVGIARIWTLPTHRRQNVASSLLDAACSHQHLAFNVLGSGARNVDGVAFSQPTALGTKLARRWTGKRSGWLVYVG